MDSSSNLEHYRFEVLVKKLNSRFSQLQLLPILENLLRLILLTYYRLTTVLLRSYYRLDYNYTTIMLKVYYRFTTDLLQTYYRVYTCTN